MFNNILESGIYPNGWCEAILCLLHKNGSVNEVGNYRGISLLPVLSKVFTKILNNRLVKWAENHNLQKEEQAGYKKNYSTIDQIFSLQALCQKYITKKKGRFYVLFIDFTKAFDTIPHNLLWYKLIKSGVHGKLLKVLNSMYSNLKSCVRTRSGLTEYFQCTVGTRQGCMLSPFLFTLYISELVDMMKNEGCQGVYVDEQNTNILMFMYADDIASGTDTVSRMQKILNVLSEYCKKWSLIVSIAKTMQILVFRRGGKIKNNEKWWFDGTPIEVVDFYKYLGVLFTSNLNWSMCKKHYHYKLKKDFICSIDTVINVVFYPGQLLLHCLIK